MASSFTWLDYSEHERRKMLDVIELFGERTTRDELGIGGIRDAFSDLLFPGTSTIQTRARYFLFVPWIYLALENQRAHSATVATRARKLESELMPLLADSGDSMGLIGRLAKGNVRRLASSVYWQGLAVWGIRTFAGSQDQYHRSLDLFYLRKKARHGGRHGFDGEAEDEAELYNWHTGLPPAPHGFPRSEGASFSLLPEEAEYLRERVLIHCPHTLLAYLLRERVVVDDLVFPWHVPDLPEKLAEIVHHGQNFSEVMHGVQLLYNLMLAEQKRSDKLVDKYREASELWAASIGQRRAALSEWNIEAFWQTAYRGNPRITPQAKAFVGKWFTQVLQVEDAAGLIDHDAARQLVTHREVQLKKGLARLRGGRPLETWSGASGSNQLDLRWTTAKQMVGDVLAGLEAPVNA